MFSDIIVLIIQKKNYHQNLIIWDIVFIKVDRCTVDIKCVQTRLE